MFTFETYVYNGIVMSTTSIYVPSLEKENLSKDVAYKITHGIKTILKVEELELKTETTWFDRVYKCDNKLILCDGSKAYISFSDDIIKPFKKYDISYYEGIGIVTYCRRNIA